MYLKIKGLAVDIPSRTLSIDNQDIELSYKEFELLTLLIESNGELVSKDQILERVWKTQHRSDSSVKKLVSELRKKIGDSVEDPIYIKTHGREGYQWIASDELLENVWGASQQTDSTIRKSTHSPREQLKDEVNNPTLIKTNETKLKTKLKENRKTISYFVFFITLFAIGIALYYPSDLSSNNKLAQKRVLLKAHVSQDKPVSAVMSPNKHYIAYGNVIGSRAEQDLYIEDLNTENGTVVKKFPNSMQLAWSTNSDKIARVDINNGCFIYVFNFKTNADTKLSGCDSTRVTPSIEWSKDNETLYVTYTNDHYPSKLYSINYLSGTRKQLVSSQIDGAGVYVAHRSFDEKYLYFVENINWERTILKSYNIETQEIASILDVDYIIINFAVLKDGIVIRNKEGGLSIINPINKEIKYFLGPQMEQIHFVRSSDFTNIALVTGRYFFVELISFGEHQDDFQKIS